MGGERVRAFSLALAPHIILVLSWPLLTESASVLVPMKHALLVVYTERSEDIVRIISARWASSSERTLYVEQMEQHS